MHDVKIERMRKGSLSGFFYQYFSKLNIFLFQELFNFGSSPV
jgi:hypothetical protein